MMPPMTGEPPLGDIPKTMDDTPPFAAPPDADDRAEADDVPAPYIPSANAGLLTAKAFSDNENFDFWRNLVGSNGLFRTFADRWNLYLEHRVAVFVRNGQGVVCGATVELLDAQGNTLWTAVSDNKGRAYLFYNVRVGNDTPVSVTVSKGGQFTDHAWTGGIPAEVTVNLEANSHPKSLDLMFVFDTTGSMSDELHYLQVEMEDIIRRVKTEQSNTPLRLSVNFYRDIGDEYIVRAFPFTADIEQAVSDLKKQNADGGGDFEEAVEQALQSAIHEHDWNDAAYAKLLFLVLDAPPHDYALEDMHRLIRDAAAKGIRIIPITCSGIDKNTEFLMRAIDVATGGTYVTLTDDSGISVGGHIEPTIIDSPVYKLNDLIVKIIGEYMK